MTRQQVSRLLNISPSTIHGVINRFVANNGKVICKRRNAGRKLKQDTKTAMSYVSQPQLLQDWAHLCLRERSQIIQDNIGITTSPSQLRYIYKRLGIAYRIPQQVYLLSRQRKLQLKQQRKDYTLYLSKIVTSNSNIIYVDETTFNFHMRQSRTWSYDDNRVMFPISNQRFSGITLYGAIGNCLKHPVFYTAESTNSESFLKFIQLLVSAIRSGIEKPILIIDNHRAHHSISVKQLMDQTFDLLFLPAYSCQYNSIEHLWAYIKKQFRQQIGLQLHFIQNQAQIELLINQITQRLPVRIVQKFVTSNRKYLIKQLTLIQSNDTSEIEY